LTALGEGGGGARSWPLHAAAVHSLRRVFTQLHHSGRLQVKSSGSKEDRELSQWLQQQFSVFLGFLARLLVAEGGRGGGGSQRTEARVLALSTAMHFFVHAAPLSSQSAPGGPFMCQEVVLWFTRHLLCAGGPGCASLYSGGGEEGGLMVYLTANMSGAAAAYRSQFVDDYDDLRIAALKAIRDVCREKAGAGGAGERAASSRKRKRSGGGGGEEGVEEGSAERTAQPPGSLGGEALSRSLVSAAHSTVVSQNALDLLLSITLPPTLKDWESTEREHWGEEQLGEALKELRGGGSRLGSSSSSSSSAASAAAAAAVHAAPASKAKFLVDSDEEGGEEGAALRAMSASSAPTPASAAASKQAYSALCKVYGEALLALLALPLPPESYRRALLALPRRILPLLPPACALQLSDFLTQACAARGATSLLALEALFFLMQRHGLQFPNFYTHLYSLLGEPSTLHAKYRARFFSQLDLYMSSAALPAYLVAAFAKRMLRVSLTAPVGVALFGIPFVYNLVKRHASLLPLLHREPLQKGGGQGEEGAGGQGAAVEGWPAPCDPFCATAEEPSEANALASSLWEVMALAQHAYAPVAHAARVLLGPLTREQYDLSEDGRVSAASGAAGTGGRGGEEEEKEEEEVSAQRTSTYPAMAEKELRRTVKRGGGGGTIPAPVAFAFGSGGGSAAGPSFSGVISFEA
jgi:hypothetical protein